MPNTPDIVFRSYEQGLRQDCLNIFDANCPDFFSPLERTEYEKYLDDQANGYEVCLLGDKIVGAFGIWLESTENSRITWIMLDPDTQGTGIGAAMMNRALQRSRDTGASHLDIAASHLSASFFAKFGAKTIKETEDGWGPGMHRVDMVLELSDLATRK